MVVSQVVPSPYNAARVIAREFLDAVRRAGRLPANFSSMEGYLAAKVLAEGRPAKLSAWPRSWRLHGRPRGLEVRELSMLRGREAAGAADAAEREGPLEAF